MADEAPIPINEARRTGRVRCRSVRCSIGDVLDLSGTGLRARTRGKPTVREGQRFDLSLHILGRTVTVGARVAWVRKAGWRRYEVGVNFENVGEAAKRSLRDLARVEAINKSILPGARKAG